MPARRRDVLRTTAVGGGFLVAGCLGDGREYGAAWADVEEIRLRASAERWEGVAPDPIAGANNPAFRLVHGRTYQIGWENVDGLAHVLEIRNHEGDPIERSEEVAATGETASLSLEAVAGVGGYTCPYYEVTMTGDIEIFSE